MGMAGTPEPLPLTFGPIHTRPNPLLQDATLQLGIRHGDVVERLSERRGRVKPGLAKRT